MFIDFNFLVTLPSLINRASKIDTVKPIKLSEAKLIQIRVVEIPSFFVFIYVDLLEQTN